MDWDLDHSEWFILTRAFQELCGERNGLLGGGTNQQGWGEGVGMDLARLKMWSS